MKRLALLFPAALLACATTGSAHADRTDASSQSGAAAQLRADMRKLW